MTNQQIAHRDLQLFTSLSEQTVTQSSGVGSWSTKNRCSVLAGLSWGLHSPHEPPESQKTMHPASSESKARCGRLQNVHVPRGWLHVARISPSGPVCTTRRRRAPIHLRP